MYYILCSCPYVIMSKGNLCSPADKSPYILPAQESWLTHMGDIWELVVRAESPIGCDVSFEATDLSNGVFQFDVSREGVYVSLDPPDTGTYNFQVVARGECGQLSRRVYNVFVLQAGPVTTLPPGMCLGKLSPTYGRSRI